MSTFTNQAKSSGAVAEENYEFQDGTNQTFMDLVDFVFRAAQTAISWANQTKN